MTDFKVNLVLSQWNERERERESVRSIFANKHVECSACAYISLKEQLQIEQ